VELPYLTADLPGTGGFLRGTHEDFQVDEIPLYPLDGEGHHVWFQITKRGIDTFEAVRRISKALDLSERQFTYAGLKDSRAVTTQWMSTQHATREQIEQLSIERLTVQQVHLHKNGLKLGHLRGNRFTLIVRGVTEGYQQRLEPILDVLMRRGAPNFFGPQRFGARRNSHLCGLAILRQDYEGFVRELIGKPSPRENDPYLRRARVLFEKGKLDQAYKAMPIRQRAEKKALHALIRFEDPERAYFAIPKRMRQIFVSAYQSYLFNEIAKRRLDELDQIAVGDLAYLHRNGAVFKVEETESTAPRCQAFEISPSGAIFGTKAPLAKGEPGEVERMVLAEASTTREDFAVGGGLSAHGSRRSLRILLRDAALTPLDETSYRFAFSLPPGAYATCVMRELMKS